MDKQQLRELLEKATPEPWTAKIDRENQEYCVVITKEHPRSIERDKEWEAMGYSDGKSPEENCITFTTCYDLPEDPANIELICYLRNHASELLEAAERAEHKQAQVEQCHALIRKIQLIVEATYPGQRYSDFDVLNRGVRKLAQEKEAAEAQRDRLEKALSLLVDCVKREHEARLNVKAHKGAAVKDELKLREFFLAEAMIAAEALKEAGNGE